MEDPFELGQYDPNDPDSEPNRELKDHIAEPVDLWVLEHDAISQDTFVMAREEWQGKGEAFPEDVPMDLPEWWNRDHARKVCPDDVRQYVSDLDPLVFESAELNLMPMSILGHLGQKNIIAGQMIGIPTTDGYCPTLLLTVATNHEPGEIADSFVNTIHIANDVFGDEPEEMAVIF